MSTDRKSLAPEPAVDSDAIRRVIYYSGRVQGVGFRATVRSLSSSFRVTGFVRNLADGRVEVVAEGVPAELDRFQHNISQTMRTNIRETAVIENPATAEFSNFSIAR